MSSKWNGKRHWCQLSMSSRGVLQSDATFNRTFQITKTHSVRLRNRLQLWRQTYHFEALSPMTNAVVFVGRTSPKRCHTDLNANASCYLNRSVVKLKAQSQYTFCPDYLTLHLRFECSRLEVGCPDSCWDRGILWSGYTATNYLVQQWRCFTWCRSFNMVDVAY